MRPGRCLSLALFLWLALSVPCEAATLSTEDLGPRPPFAVEARVGYAKRLRSGAPDWKGTSYGLIASWNCFDNLRVAIDGEYLLFDNFTYRPRAHALDATLGLRYDIDTLIVYPVVGLGAGIYAEKPQGRSFTTRGVYHLLIALEGRITPTIGLGVEFKPHLTQLKLEAWGFYYTLGAKLIAYF